MNDKVTKDTENPQGWNQEERNTGFLEALSYTLNLMCSSLSVPDVLFPTRKED